MTPGLGISASVAGAAAAGGPSAPAILGAIAGLVVGAAVAAGVAAWAARRSVRRVRDAERRARAAERLAEIGAMTGGLAHEIKNPLSTIGLNAQLLAEGIAELRADPDEKARLERRVGALRREADRLAGILSDFLQYAGEPRLSPEPVDLNMLVGELADFFAPQAAAAGVTLRAVTAAEPLIARLDPAAAKQAVLNLMLNAVQAMSADAGPPHGARARELILRTERAGDAGRPVVRLHVIDTGPGIDPAARARIFEPYFTTRPGGTGLGLPTTRRLVEAQDGRIEVFSEPGKGSDFVLTFPAARA